MLVTLLLLELGAILLYAGITGRSVYALIAGDNTRKAAVPAGAVLEGSAS